LNKRSDFTDHFSTAFTRRDRLSVRALPRMAEERTDIVGYFAREHMLPQARSIRGAFRAHFENLIEKNLGKAVAPDELFSTLSSLVGEFDDITVSAEEIGPFHVRNQATHLRPPFADRLYGRVSLFMRRPDDTEGFFAVSIELTMQQIHGLCHLCSSNVGQAVRVLIPVAFRTRSLDIEPDHSALPLDSPKDTTADPEESSSDKSDTLYQPFIYPIDPVYRVFAFTLRCDSGSPANE